jgi:DnaJ domain
VPRIPRERLGHRPSSRGKGIFGMTGAMMLSSVAFGLSLLASAFKLVDWYINADPREVIKTGKRVLISLFILSLPLLAALLAYRQWSLAMLLGAGNLTLLAVFGHRALTPIRAVFHLGMREDRGLGRLSGLSGRHSDDPELVRRAAEILAAYLDQMETSPPREGVGTGTGSRTHQAGGASWDGPMSRDQALDVLGLEASADAVEIRKAHRRLIQMVHPDRGGSNYLAAKINQAKEILLGEKI